MHSNLPPSKYSKYHGIEHVLADYSKFIKRILHPRRSHHEEIRELAANGGTICSHSVSHQNMSQRRGKSADAYAAWLREELEESHNFLEQNFGDTGAVVDFPKF